MDFTSFKSQVGSQKRQKYLIFVLVAIIFVILFLAWNYFLKKPPSFYFEPVPPPEIRIDFAVLENPDLEELQLFEEISPFEGEIGRENPFIPY